MKSSDKYTVPLCINCHYRQHAGERTFWAELQIDPIDATSALWTHSGDLDAGERIIEEMINGGAERRNVSVKRLPAAPLSDGHQIEPTGVTR